MPGDSGARKEELGYFIKVRHRTFLPNHQHFLNCQVSRLLKDINNELSRNHLPFKIVKAIDEDFRIRKNHYVLVNRLDRSSDSTQLTKKAMVDFSPAELEYLKLIMEEIVESEEREIGHTKALNLTRNVKTKSMKPNDGQNVLSKFVDRLWLKKNSERNTIRLSTRFIAEMEPYLDAEIQLQKCFLCKNKLVVRVRGNDFVKSYTLCANSISHFRLGRFVRVLRYSLSPLLHRERLQRGHHKQQMRQLREEG